MQAASACIPVACVGLGAGALAADLSLPGNTPALCLYLLAAAIACWLPGSVPLFAAYACSVLCLAAGIASAPSQGGLDSGGTRLLVIGAMWTHASLVARERAAIARRDHAHAELQERESKLRSVIENSPVVSLLLDLEGKVTFATPALPFHSTVGPVLGRPLRRVFSPDDARRLDRLLALVRSSRKAAGMETTLHDEGRKRWWALRVGPVLRDEEVIAYVIVGTEFTDRKLAEDALQRSERLASIGTLATGIAHEINNPVGSILLAAQYALTPESSAAEVRRALDEIVNEAKRCGRVVQGILRFSRHRSRQRQRGRLESIVERAVELTRRYASNEGCNIHVRACSPLPELVLDETEIEQVVINLVQNAVQAGATEVRLQTGIENGSACLDVSDNGAGIDTANRRRIFDPFFTTRQSCGGTGLGLSIAHGIVSGHGGSIELESRPGHGATFRVLLPIPPRPGLAATEACASPTA